MSQASNAFLRPRRHSDTALDNLDKSDNTAFAPHKPTDARNDSIQPFSSSSSFRPLLLPAHLEIRRVSTRAKLETRPKRSSTGSVRHLHELRPRQVSTTLQTIEQALEGVTGSSNCREIVQGYGEDEPAGQLRRACGAAVAIAREREAASSTSSMASSSTSTPNTPTTTTVRSARVTTTRRSTTRSRRSPQQTVTATSAPTGRVAPVVPSLSPSQASAASAALSLAASSASRAVLQSSVDSLFSDAASEVSSRRAAATASSSLSSPSSSTPPVSSTSSAPSSASTLGSETPSSTSSGLSAGATSTGSRSNHNRIVDIVVPSLVVPIGVLLLLLLGFCFWRRRKRRRAQAAGLGPISHPRPLQASARAYGAVGPAGAAAAGGGAMVEAAGGRTGNSSQESFGTTPSAIGVAFSEPRTRWGRRSLVDVLASGVRGANTPDCAAAAAPPPKRGHQHSSSFGGGRQPSITSLPSVQSHNNYTYQPGQLRPVMTPISQHYDSFGPPSIVPVPATAQRHHYRPSDASSQSGYGASDSGPSRSTSGASLTERLAPPLAGGFGYAHAPAAQQSRTTQTSEGVDGYWTADPGPSSQDYHEAEELSEEGPFRNSPEQEAVYFGSSSGSGSGRSSEDPNATPRVTSGSSTPRLGAGHGSGFGNRRNDGTGSWWN
ncbi:hypothetical protein JCM11641_002375 [Rhodosporidiobolus odoratus]